MKVGNRTAAVIAVALLACVVSAAQADTITLSGTVRDFNDSHPDFENGCCGLVSGIVQAGIGLDSKPVYAHGPPPACNGGAACGFTHGDTFFNEWYNDVVGVNLASSLDIVLDNTITADPNIFTYVNGAFFPIDGQLFGNQGRSHNYHFTYEIHSSFTYQGGEVFTFTGDDDIFVFINGQLVIDLGGVHGAASQSVVLDTLGLTLGNTYPFDFFFAERHTTQSNFRIDTSIALEPVACMPHSQGFWHRQCLGIPAADGGIDPGRNGRGPQLPTEPEFAAGLMPCAEGRIVDLGFYSMLTCEGMDADPPSDACERAKKQFTAMVLNVCSSRLSEGCEVDVSGQGCASTNVGDLLGEVAELIQNGDCVRAADCAGAVNTSDGLVQGGGESAATPTGVLPDRDDSLRQKGLRKGTGQRTQR